MVVVGVGGASRGEQVSQSQTCEREGKECFIHLHVDGNEYRDTKNNQKHLFGSYVAEMEGGGAEAAVS